MTTQAREGLLNGWDVILVSDCDWAELPSRRQVFARMFAQSGNRVIYVEPMESLPLLFESLKSEKVGRFAQGITQAEHNLWVLSPPPAAPGDAESPLINRMNNNVLRARIETEAKSLGFRKRSSILTRSNQPSRLWTTLSCGPRRMSFGNGSKRIWSRRWIARYGNT